MIRVSSVLRLFSVLVLVGGLAAVVNLGDLNECFEDGAEVTPALLKEKNLAKQNYDVLKILGDGELTKKLKVHAHRFSKSAAEKIAAAGGECVVLPGKSCQNWS